MKIVRIIIYILIALVVLFFAFGLLKPSVSYGHEISVNKSVKESWAVTQDVTKNALWLDGFKSLELISGEKGAVGSKYKVIVNPGDGQEDFEMVETIISMAEFDHIKLHFDSDFMDFEQTMTFRDFEDKTKIKTDSKVIGKSIVMRSMFAIMEILGGSFTSQETKNLEALKKVIEQNTTDYYPVPQIIEAETMPTQ